MRIPDNDGELPEDDAVDHQPVATPEDEPPEDPGAELGDGWVRA